MEVTLIKLLNVINTEHWVVRYLLKVFLGRVVHNVVPPLVLYMDATFLHCIEVIMVLDVRKLHKLSLIQSDKETKQYNRKLSLPEMML